jgi:hypothetical protein
VLSTEHDRAAATDTITQTLQRVREHTHVLFVKVISVHMHALDKR